MFSKLGSLASQLLNVVLYGGETDESVSARCHREGFLGKDPEWEERRRFVNKLFFLQEDHCKAASDQDKAYAEKLIAMYKVYEDESG